MFTDNVSCATPAHMVTVQLIQIIRGLEKTNCLAVAYNRRKKDKCKLSYDNMQTNSVCQNLFLILFSFILFVNNKP